MQLRNVSVTAVHFITMFSGMATSGVSTALDTTARLVLYLQAYYVLDEGPLLHGDVVQTGDEHEYTTTDVMLSQFKSREPS